MKCLGHGKGMGYWTGLMKMLVLLAVNYTIMIIMSESSSAKYIWSYLCF